AIFNNDAAHTETFPIGSIGKVVAFTTEEDPAQGGAALNPADFQIRYTDQDHDAVALNNGDSMKGYDIFNDGVSAAPATSAIVCEGAPGDDSITIDTVTIEGKTAGASGDNIAIGMNLDLNCPSSVSNSTIDQTAFGVIAGGQTPASRT